MKICDKCRKELPPDYVQIQYPAFYIRKMTQNSVITGEEINLCHSCSKAFEKWLDGQEEYKPEFQEEYKPKFIKNIDGSIESFCGNCNNYINYYYDNYCSSCGKKIKGVIT